MILFPAASQRVTDTTCDAIEWKLEGGFKATPTVFGASAWSWTMIVALSTPAPQSVISYSWLPTVTRGITNDVEIHVPTIIVVPY